MKTHKEYKMKTNENTITQMGILSELVYNDKKDDNGMNIEYFKEGVILTAGETKYKVIDSTSNYIHYGALMRFY